METENIIAGGKILIIDLEDRVKESSRKKKKQTKKGMEIGKREKKGIV